MNYDSAPQRGMSTQAPKARELGALEALDRDLEHISKSVALLNGRVCSLAGRILGSQPESGKLSEPRPEPVVMLSRLTDRLNGIRGSIASIEEEMSRLETL